MVHNLHTNHGPLTNWRLPPTAQVRIVHPRAYVTEALRSLYRHLTHYVHPKPETMDTTKAPEQPQYDRERFTQLAQLLTDTLTLAKLLINGRPINEY